MFNPVKSVQSVSEFTASLKGLLETTHPFVNLQGEVSNLRIPYSGHMYFILKDDHAQIRAVLFKGQRRFLQKEFKDGDQIICTGRITLYEPRGDYQIIIDSAQIAGQGNMLLEYAKLKDKLEHEGLFADSLKKPLPTLPQKICVITSPSGAAIHDFLKIALKKHPNLQVEIIATPMQGEHAPGHIIHSLGMACRRNWADAVVICRGGGSIEDLWAFNDETLARCISKMPLPVISAIGHEVDFTIADFVADLRAPTPTAAADIIIPNMLDFKMKVQKLKKNIVRAVKEQQLASSDYLKTQIKFLGDPRSILDQQQFKIDHLTTELELALSKALPKRKEKVLELTSRLSNISPKKIVRRKTAELQLLQNRLKTAEENSLRERRNKLQHQALMLDTLSPLAVLGRGYSITTNAKTKHLLSTVRDIEINDVISIQLQDGAIIATTNRIKIHPK